MTWETMMLASWNQFIGGDIIGASISSYTNIMGFWFYALFLLLTMTMIQLRLNNFNTTALVGMLISASVIPLMPANTQKLIAIIIILAIGTILYRVFHK